MLLVVINSIAFRMQLTTWILLPGIRDVNPRLCPAVSGKSPRSLGYESSCPWLYFLIVSGTVAHGRGYRSSWSLAISS
mgnify:CR=1 FL=1